MTQEELLCNETALFDYRSALLMETEIGANCCSAEKSIAGRNLKVWKEVQIAKAGAGRVGSPETGPANNRPKTVE